MSNTNYSVAGAVALALLLGGCGGGGGGSDDSSDSDASTSTTSSQKVSGNVTLSSLVADSSASTAADEETATTASVATTTASVAIRSYQQDGTLLDTAQVTAGEEGGLFSAKLDLHNDGGYVVIDIRSPGTSGWSKRINYEEPSDIDISAEVRAAQTVVQDLSDSFKASAEENKFRFGVVRYTDGSRKAVAGSAAIAAAKASDGAAGMELEIEIPQAEVNVDTLRANMLTYDPSSDDDAQSFPGDYLDEFGNRLVSVGFDSVEITDDEGRSVSELAEEALESGAASKANAEGVTVRRWIPSGTCASVEEFWSAEGHTGVDENGNPVVEENGNSIPIYTYNPVQGAWDLLGTGTVQSYSTDDTTYSDVTEFDTTACTSGAYYLNIAISSEDYINAWWNLDYPLLTEMPTEKCVDLTFKDSNGDTLSGLYAEISGTGLNRNSGSSRSDGTLKLSAVVTSGDPSTANLSYYNPFDYSYQQLTGITVGDSGGCAAKEVVVERPRTCTVTGTVTKSGDPLANATVWAYSANPYAYAWDYTDEDGAFNTEVRCDVDMDLYVGNSLEKQFRVDKVKGADEVSDDGDQVALGTIAKSNTLPNLYGYLSSYSVQAGSKVTARFYAWDNDGAADYPLAYTVSGAGVSATGDVLAADGEKTVTIDATDTGSYPITVSVTDQSGGNAERQIGTLEVVSGNRAPVISYAYTGVGDTVRLNRDGSLDGFNLYAYAYDPDGDTLSRGWSCSGCTVALPTGSDIAFAGGTGYSAGDTLTFTYTANDGSATATRTVTVDVLAASNSTPYFTTLQQTADTVETVPSDVTFTAEATDGDGDPLTYTWMVDGVEQSTASGSSFTLSIPSDAGDPTTYTVTVSVTDGLATVSHEFTVTYSTADPNTTVIIQ